MCTLNQKFHEKWTISRLTPPGPFEYNHQKLSYDKGHTFKFWLTSMAFRVFWFQLNLPLAVKGLISGYKSIWNFLQQYSGVHLLQLQITTKKQQTQQRFTLNNLNILSKV